MYWRLGGLLHWCGLCRGLCRLGWLYGGLILLLLRLPTLWLLLLQPQCVKLLLHLPHGTRHLVLLLSPSCTVFIVSTTQLPHRVAVRLLIHLQSSLSLYSVGQEPTVIIAHIERTVG